MNKAKCLQMLGRVRVQKQDIINLYIKRFDNEDIDHKIYNIDDIKCAYYAYDKSCENIQKQHKYKMYFYTKYYDGESTDLQLAKHLFRRLLKYPECVVPNEIAKSLIFTISKRYESIMKEELQELDNSDNYEEYLHGQKYLEYQLSWFDKKYDKSNDLTIYNYESNRSEFAEYIETLIDTEIPNEEQRKSLIELDKDIQKDSREKIQKNFGKNFQKNFYKAYGFRTKEKGFSANDNTTDVTNNGYGMSKINEILKVLYDNKKLEIYLQIETEYPTKTKTNGYWKIRDKSYVLKDE